MEVLVVIGLIGVLSVVLIGTLSGSGKSAALQSGQGMLSSLALAGRSRAMATGHRTRLLVNADPAAGRRFRRALALQEETPTGSWLTSESFLLPEGVYVVPYRNRIPSGIFQDAALWTKFASSESLESSSLSAAPLLLAVGSGILEYYEYIQFLPAGTTGGSGNIIVGAGRPRSPGSFAEGESPVQLENPEFVRGISLSAYGLPRLINDRTGF